MPTKSLHQPTFLWINIGLAVLALGLLVYYVMQANTLAAQSWQMRASQERLSQIREERNALVAQQATFDDRTVLEQLAHREGFVPAGAVVYVVQDSAVAAR